MSDGSGTSHVYGCEHEGCTTLVQQATAERHSWPTVFAYLCGAHGGSGNGDFPMSPPVSEGGETQ